MSKISDKLNDMDTGLSGNEAEQEENGQNQQNEQSKQRNNVLRNPSDKLKNLSNNLNNTNNKMGSVAKNMQEKATSKMKLANSASKAGDAGKAGKLVGQAQKLEKRAEKIQKTAKKVEKMAKKAEKFSKLALKLGKIIAIVGWIILILIIVIGLLTFIIMGWGMLLSGFKELSRGFFDTCKGYISGKESVVHDEEIVGVLKNIEEMGYDLYGYGFVSSREKDDEGNKIYYEIKGEGDDEERKLIKSLEKKDAYRYITTYMISDNYAYFVKNHNFNFNALGDRISDNIFTMFNVLWKETSWGSGLISVYKQKGDKNTVTGERGEVYGESLATKMVAQVGGLAGKFGTELCGLVFSWDEATSSVDVNRDAKTLEISAIGLSKQTYSYSLDGWTGRYSMPLEFLLATHIATMAPDLSFKLATSFDTDVEILLVTTSGNETEGGIELEDGTTIWNSDLAELAKDGLNGSINKDDAKKILEKYPQLKGQINKSNSEDEEDDDENEDNNEISSRSSTSSTSNQTQGNPLVMAAKDIKDYMADNNYYYGPVSDDSGYSEGFGVYTASSFEESQSWVGSQSVVTCDCSAYMSWALQECGVLEKGDKKDTYGLISWAQSKGWYISGSETLKPGDIIMVYGGAHTQMYGENGEWYNAGTTDAIRGEPHAYDAVSEYRWYRWNY